MLIFRLIVGLLLVAGVLCFGVYIATGRPVWRRRAIVVIKWTVLAVLGAVALLVLERVVTAL